jgi:hypothetical protein
VQDVETDGTLDGEEANRGENTPAASAGDAETEAAEVASETDSVEDTRAFLEIIQRETARMESLISSIREISKIDTSLQDEETEIVDARAVVRQVKKSMHYGRTPLFLSPSGLSRFVHVDTVIGSGIKIFYYFGAGFCAVALPQLGALGFSVCGKNGGPVHGPEIIGVGGKIAPRIDILDQDRPGIAAVGFPQLIIATGVTGK